MPTDKDQDSPAQTQSVMRRVAVTIGVTLVMFVLAAGLTMAIYSWIGPWIRGINGGTASYFGGTLALFAVAFVCARKRLASQLQCTIAALPIGVLVMAFALTVERRISLLPFTYLLLALPAWLGASPKIHPVARR